MVCSPLAVFSVQSENGDGVSFKLPVANPVSDVFTETRRRFKLTVADMLKYQLLATPHVNGNGINLNGRSTESLEEVGFQADETYKIQMVPIKDRAENIYHENNVPSPASSGDNDDLASPSAMGDIAPPPEPPPPPPTVIKPSNRWPVVNHYNEVPSSSAVPYVGLVNQAMTCYLNSLLQALFMTPEFRNALYHWQYNGLSDESKSMPYQLQKLFLNLQTSNRASVETTALTRSFGWNSSEAWQQHDIQELCRVMFDVLEVNFKGTDQADLINRLYEGTMLDYVKCLECSTEKHREDKFLDIPLPVRPFQSAVAYGSVDEALHAFVEPETLDGNNQYFCERCGKKCDAHKGLKFTKFPYLLTLHLKRFDFDYNTLNRIKLNDKVTFPVELNLNRFIPTKGEAESPGETIEDMVKCDDSSTTDSGSALDEDKTFDLTAPSNHIEYNVNFGSKEDDEGIDVGNSQESEKNRFNAADSEPGPYIYELFSIMIHSGSASGGHYYAYIKDFKDDEWYCFNDQSVTRITYDDIQKTYGGGRGYYSSTYSTSTNAYMLMYRQKDSERNTTAMTPEDFPPHIKSLLVKMEEEKKDEFRRREMEHELIRIKCYYEVNRNSETIKSRIFPTKRDVSLLEVTKDVLECIDFESKISPEQCRLVAYDHTRRAIECSFDGRENESIDVLLNDFISNQGVELFLQIKDNDQPFEVYRQGDINTKVLVIKPENDEIEEPMSVRINKEATIGQYREQLAKLLNSDPGNVHLLLDRYNREPLLLTTDNEKLGGTIYPNIRVFAVCGPLNDIARIQKICDWANEILMLHIKLPDAKSENMDDIKKQAEGCEACKADSGGGDHDRDRERETSPHPLPDHEDFLAGPPSDQSASEDSSLTDSERTIVGEAPGHSTVVSPTGSPDMWEQSPTSPENERADETRLSNWYKGNEMNRLNAATSRLRDASGEKPVDDSDDVEIPRYFRAVPNRDGWLRVQVDKRISVQQLKSKLSGYVGVCTHYFKLFRSSSGTETECQRPGDTLKMWRDDERLMVVLGRALRPGEHPGKVYLLDLKNPDHPYKFLCDWRIATGADVTAVKKELLEEIKKNGVDIPLSRCRLRCKEWKSPGRLYMDHTPMNDIISDWEIYIQELDGPEPVTKPEQQLIFVRHWCPATLKLLPLQEFVLNSNQVSELRQKISEVSEIPDEFIEIAKAEGVFPYNMDPRKIHSDLDWCVSKEVKSGVYIFRDKRESVKPMTNEESRELVVRDRTAKLAVRSLTQKKERALKIYVDSSPPSRKRDDSDVD